MTDNVKIGVTGTGGLGMTLSRGINGTEKGKVVAVADVDDENLTQAGEELGISSEYRFSDHEEMLDNTGLDGVAIATPHTLHYDQTIAALERSIDTLCEKPLCTDLKKAKDLVRRSERADATLTVGYQRHLDGAFQRARNELENQVGDPQFLTAEVTQDWIAHQRGAWRTDPDLSGGGQLYDTGSHLVDVVLWTTTLEPVSVNAQMMFDDADRRVDKQAALDVQFHNGAVATISVSGDAPCVREHFHAWGSEGGFYIDGEGWDPRELTYINPDGDEHQPSLKGYGDRTKAEAFIETIVDGTEPPATARDALKVTALTEAAYESARTGHRVDIDTSLD